MLEIFELVIRELLIGSNNLKDLRVRLIKRIGDDCIEVSLYFKLEDILTFWHDTRSINELVMFYYRGFELSKRYYIRLRFLFHEEINS